MMSDKDNPTVYQDVTTSFSATCTACGMSETSAYLTHDIKSDFVKMLREFGWSHRKAGWMCPDCITQQKALRKG